MAGPDAYKEFDNSSIVTTTTDKGSVSLGRFTFRKRDLLLGGIAIVALILVIILAIVLATNSSSNDSCDNNSKTQAQTGSGTPDDQLPYCVTPECLKTATYQRPIMNPKISPCDNFYSYACGEYHVHHPQTPLIVDVTPTNEILFENTENLLYLLDYPVTNDKIHSYERKLKDFMKSCNNHFDKMDLRGRPLLEKIIQPLGGWYMLGTYNESDFDFNDLFRKIHIDFWADPFVTLSTRTDKTNWNNRIVEFTFSGMTLDYRFYSDIPALHPYQQIYRSYISLIAQLLTIDAGVSPDASRLQNFISDVYEIESSISQILTTAALLPDNHEPDNRITLEELQKDMNYTIDFVTYMKTLFNEWPGHFEPDTKVAVTVVNYFNQLGPLIGSYLQTSEGIRKLHNYMMWQVIAAYAGDLSWDYVHAERKLNHLLYGYKDDTSGYLYCFSVAQSVFTKAMSAVYVKQHIKDKGKNETNNILDRIRDILVDQLQNLSWMTQDDRKEAIDKIKESLYKIGFPKDLVDEDYMDAYYYHVKISETDFFGNILAVNRMYQKAINDAVGKPDFKTAWPYHVFVPAIEYYNPWSELIATAAMLQNPLFHPDAPAYYKYGGIGSRLASNLIHAVDEIGSTYKLDGSHFGSWWSNMTRQHYNDIKQCAIRNQKKEDFGTFLNIDGGEVNINTSLFASLWTPEILADSSGVRIAYKAFKDQQKNGVSEKLPPGFESLNADKMFFVSYAQSFCRNVPEYVKTAQTLDGDLPRMNKVNMAMKNIPEFMDAFNCPKPDEYQQCLLFGK